MADNESFRVNAPDVLHETIDGEVVLVNMKSGAYYSIDKVGAAIWELLADGTSTDHITEVLTRRFKGDRDAIAESVARLLASFRDEELVVADTEPGERTATSMNPDTPVPASRPRFEEPVLQKYTDMQQLLLLDPIHEVDETGWPTEKATDPEQPR